MHESKFDWTNAAESPAELVYEPDGMSIDIPPGASVRVVCQGSEPGELEVEHEGNALVVYGWPTSTAQIFVGEALVYSSFAFPPLPPSMSTKQFIRVVLGGRNSETDEPG